MLKDQLENQGGWLFRWRSFLPALLLPLVAFAFYESRSVLTLLGEDSEAIWDAVCIALSFAGLGVRILTVGFVPAGTSGRNTQEQRASELNTTGIYGTVRHPLYLANYLMFLGFVLALKVWWFALIAVLVYILYYERIMMAEERFLQSRFGARYTEWASRTPAFLPRLSGWTTPAYSFSLRSVLRREYNGFYLILVYFTLLDLLTDLVLEGESFVDWAQAESAWLATFAAGTLAYVVLRHLKKHTGLLRVAGR